MRKNVPHTIVMSGGTLSRERGANASFDIINHETVFIHMEFKNMKFFLDLSM